LQKPVSEIILRVFVLGAFLVFSIVVAFISRKVNKVRIKD